MVTVHYPRQDEGEVDSIVGWMSGGEKRQAISMNPGDMLELDDSVAAQLCMTYKFLVPYNKKEFAKHFPRLAEKRAKKLAKEEAAKDAELKEKVKEAVAEVKEEESGETEEVEKVGDVFVCEVCGKECKSKAGLLAHMRSHEDEELK